MSKAIRSLFLSVLAVAVPAFGVTIVDADAFPAGTILNNAFPGVTLTAIGDAGVLANSNVLSAADANATTGTLVFADTSGSPRAWGNGLYSYLRVDFAAGASSVSLDFAADDSSDSNPFIEAYDSSNNLLDSDTVGFVTLGSPVTLTVTSPGIAYIIASWDQTNRADNGLLDNLQYQTAVPEPSTLGLLSLGGLAMLGLRRRTR
jgi:hypothetical protein